MNAWKFNKSADCELNDLKDSKVYRLREKLDNGEKLSRDEKNWITKQLRDNFYSCTAIPLMGWLFSFADVAKRFWVQQYGSIREEFAIDKTAIRKTTYGRIDRIVEVA